SETAPGKEVERSGRFVVAAIADQCPGLEDGAGDALEAVGAELVEAADRGGVATVLERLGRNDELRELVGRLELEHAVGSIDRAIDFAVSGEGNEGGVDNKRIVPLLGSGLAQILSRIRRAELAHGLLAGKI